MHKLDEHQRQALQRLQVHAHWNDVRQDRYYDSARAAVCPHCKVKAATDLHLWECQGLPEYRKSLDDSLADLDPYNTPAHLLIGIPEKFTAGLTGHYCRLDTRDGIVGGDLHSTFLYKVRLTWQQEMSIHRLCHGEKSSDTQHLAYKCLATVGGSALPDIEAIIGTAPAEPNTANDGGLKHPGKNLAFGTFGSWEWDRQYAQLTPEELAFARLHDHANPARSRGILLAGTIAGILNSSTRAELAGVITALWKPIPVHIALDNKGVVVKAHGIVSGNRRTRKHWQLTNDGDLWQLFEFAIRQRGPGTTAFSWTKGHASWKWIGEHSTNALSIASGQADLAADEGAIATGQAETQAALDYHASKQHAYELLMFKLQLHAASILLHDRFLRQQAGLQDEGRKAPPEYIQTPACSPRQCFTLGISLDLHPLPPSSLIQADPLETCGIGSLECLHVFWGALRWKHDQSSRPTTWLELFGVFRLMGEEVGVEIPMRPCPF